MWSISFCLADDGVHHNDEQQKKNYLYFGSNILKYKVANQTNHHAVFLFFDLKKDYM